MTKNARRLLWRCPALFYPGRYRVADRVRRDFRIEARVPHRIGKSLTHGFETLSTMLNHEVGKGPLARDLMPLCSWRIRIARLQR